MDDNLPGLPNQRRLVQWLFSDDVKVNSYKRFDLSSGGYIIAQISNVINEGLNSVDNATLTAVPKVRNQKKAEIIIKQNRKIKSLEELASANNTTIKKALALNQKSGTVSGAGREPLVVGIAFGTELNNFSDLIIGENGIYKIKVIKKEKSSNLETYSSYKNQLLSSRSISQSTLYQSIKESAEVVDNRSTYF